MIISVIRNTLLASMVLTILMACEPTPSVTESETEMDNATAQEVNVALDGSWVLLSLAGEPAPPLHRQPSLEFHDAGAVGGFAGVNTFRSQFRQSPDSDRVSFEQGALTMMAGPEDAMAFERAYMDALGSVERYEFRDGQLVLTGDAGIELVFEAQSP